MMHCDARALNLCPCITPDVLYDARMMHRDALVRLITPVFSGAIFAFSGVDL